MELSDESLRLKCFEIVTNSGIRNDFPVYSMIEATMLFTWIKKGSLPIRGIYKPSEMYLEKLLEKAVDELAKERANRDQSAQGSDNNTNDLQVSESIFNRFMKRFRTPYKSL